VRRNARPATQNNTHHPPPPQKKQRRGGTSATGAPTTAAPTQYRQDPRADPRDHILRGTYASDSAGDLTFAVLNAALWAADAALFRRYWLPRSAAKLANVQLLLGMVRVCAFCLGLGVGEEGGRGGCMF
jgi:hypothetical protein